jgi:hypothetical protein
VTVADTGWKASRILNGYFAGIPVIAAKNRCCFAAIFGFIPTTGPSVAEIEHAG